MVEKLSLQRDLQNHVAYNPSKYLTQWVDKLKLVAKATWYSRDERSTTFYLILLLLISVAYRGNQSRCRVILFLADF